MIFHWALALLLGFRAAAQTAEYYQNIWDENIAKTETWVRPTNNSEFDNYTDDNLDGGTYDFIVVGGGSTGATLASRLSENRNWNILLLDAGGNETDFTLMPGAFFPIQLSDINWGYLTSKQRYACFGCKNNQCDFARGKVLGGGSALNAMLFVRGNPADYDDWYKQGNAGWSYKDVLPYFKKMENASTITNGEANEYRGNDGPLSVTLNNPRPSYARYIMQAAGELGYKDEDYNAKTQINTMADMQVTLKFGRRHSSNQAYLQPIIASRTNLRVITKALAIKLVVSNRKNKKVTHVKFIHKGHTYLAKAKKEIIVSAGAVNSPQLLMLSGIGPRRELTKHGIDVISDLPVGRNLEDHPTVFNILIDTNLTYENPSFNELLSEYAKGRGSFSYTNGQEVGFTDVVDRQNATTVPDVEYIMFQTSNFNQPGWIYRQANYDSVMNASLTNQKRNAIVAHIMLLHPKSTGSITLNSSNPIHFPINDPNYLSHPDDMKTLIKAVYKLLKLLDTDTFKSINATVPRSYIELCDALSGDAYWDCFIRHKLAGIFHPVSTCRMGKDSKTSVVNNKLLVHGFQNLRVADASIFPNGTSGHPNAPCIMIGEKLADELKSQYK